MPTWKLAPDSPTRKGAWATTLRRPFRLSNLPVERKSACWTATTWVTALRWPVCAAAQQVSRAGQSLHGWRDTWCVRALSKRSLVEENPSLMPAFAGWGGAGCVHRKSRPCSHIRRRWGFSMMDPRPIHLSDYLGGKTPAGVGPGTCAGECDDDISMCLSIQHDVWAHPGPAGKPGR